MTAHFTLPIASHQRIRSGDGRSPPASSYASSNCASEPTPATGFSLLPKRHERTQSQPMSSAGSPEWHSSQSITAARPDAPTIRFPRRKSPCTRHSRAGGGGGCSRSQRRPTSTAGSGSPTPSRVASHSSQAANAGSESEAETPSISRPSIEWIRASACPSCARSTRGATEVPATWSIANPALSRRPSAGSNAIGRGTGTPAAAAAWTTRNSTSSGAKESRAPRGSLRTTQRRSPASARNVSLDAPPGIVESASAPGSDPSAWAISARIPTASASSGGWFTVESVPCPMAVRDVRGVLVPVPGARIAIEVLRGIRRIDRIADPANRQRLVHERAVRAIQRKSLALVAPVVRLAGDPESLRAVAAVSPQPLPRSAGVHRERDLLVVLGDLEGARAGTDAAGGVGTPGGRQRLRDRPAIAVGDPLDRLPPAALQRVRPGLLHAVVAEPLLHEGDQARDPVDQQIVHELRFGLHRLAERLRLLEVTGLDRLHRPLHRRPRHLPKLLVAEPPVTHRATSRRSPGHYAAEP